MKTLIFLSLLLLIFVGFFHPITSMTQDLGRHLKTGEIILQTHLVPKTNLFSYTYPDFPFINHHWLSEVIYYFLFQGIGFNGLLILNTLVVLGAFGLILLILNKKTSTFNILICSLLYIPILFERTDLRPETFSFLFLSLFLFILYRFREKPTRLIFLLPLIELFWVNMHIYFPIGIVITLFFFLDHLFLKKLKNDKQTLMLGTVLILVTLITLINPNGLKGALYPLSVFQNYGYSIEENQNIFFLWSVAHKQSILFFFITAPAFIISLLLNFKRFLPAEWLISIFFTMLAVLSIRNFPLFVFATLVVFIKSFPVLSFNKNVKIALLVFLFIFYAFVAQQIYTKKGFGFGVEEGAQKGADFFIKENLKGPIFNNFDIGSYLDYRLYPKERVFVDGRPEAYPAAFFQNEYIPMQLDQNKFLQMDRKYHFNTIFFSHTDQTPWGNSFINQVTQNPDWNMVYLDDWIVILTKDKKIKPAINTDYPNMQSLLQLGNFFQKTNFEDEEINIYQKILKINPNYCPALYNLTLKLQEKNDPSFPIFLSRLQNNCK